MSKEWFYTTTLEISRVLKLSTLPILHIIIRGSSIVHFICIYHCLPVLENIARPS